MKIKSLTLLLLAVFTICSCSSSKKINSILLSDAEMKLAMKKVEKLENSFMLYREGASGANGGKGGGGCGCN
jgi:hypothetical protein